MMITTIITEIEVLITDEKIRTIIEIHTMHKEIEIGTISRRGMEDTSVLLMIGELQEKIEK